MAASSQRTFVPASSDEEEEERGGDNIAGGLKGIFTQKIAILMVFVPVAFILRLQEVEPVYHFSFNFLAIIPLAWLISECTEHLEKKVGPALGVLLNSTFGNVVEIILSIQAIRNGLVKIVQSSLLGAILSNLLFVLGCCFLVVGMKKSSTEFNTNNASYNLTLLAVAAMALMVPTSLAVFDEWSVELERLELSRGVAFFLGTMYFQWLFFNLSTHAQLFAQKPAIPGRNSSMKMEEDEQRAKTGMKITSIANAEAQADEDAEDSDDDDGPTLPMWFASMILLFATVLVTFHCDWLVESIGPVTKQLGIKEAFIATVLLPMVGNFSEEIAAVSIASKGKIDLAMGVAIGSATQIATLVIPITVFLGWYLDQPLDLDFEAFQVKLLMMAILVVSLCLQDGQANWLKGTMLITTYIIVAAAFWFIHDQEFSSEGVAPITDPYLKANNETLNATRRLFV